MNPQQAGQHQISSNISSLNDSIADDMSDAQKAKNEECVGAGKD